LAVTVVTNTANIAMELSKWKDVNVFATGGLHGEWFSLADDRRSAASRTCSRRHIAVVDHTELNVVSNWRICETGTLKTLIKRHRRGGRADRDLPETPHRSSARRLRASLQKKLISPIEAVVMMSFRVWPVESRL
jgi:DeoR/GlpR family transcriptional regulator of sugar metabolism